MIQRRGFQLLTIASIAIGVLNSIAIAAPATIIKGNNVPLFYKVPPKGKQIALDEAIALGFANEHIRNADSIAAKMLTKINSSTTGWFGTMMLNFPGSTASNLEADASDFRSEAATAFVEITLLEGGIENPVSDIEYKSEQQVAASLFTLMNRVSPDQYRMQLQSMLQTLSKNSNVATAAFKAKWGIGYTEALQ